MAEDQDLEVLGPVVPREVAATGRETAEDGEGEARQHSRRIDRCAGQSESGFWHPSGSAHTVQIGVFAPYTCPDEELAASHIKRENAHS